MLTRCIYRIFWNKPFQHFSRNLSAILFFLPFPPPSKHVDCATTLTRRQTLPASRVYNWGTLLHYLEPDVYGGKYGVNKALKGFIWSTRIFFCFPLQRFSKINLIFYRNCWWRGNFYFFGSFIVRINVDGVVWDRWITAYRLSETIKKILISERIIFSSIIICSRLLIFSFNLTLRFLTFYFTQILTFEFLISILDLFRSWSRLKRSATRKINFQNEYSTTVYKQQT